MSLGVVGERGKARHLREVERSSLIVELISIDRDLVGEDSIELSLRAGKIDAPSVPTASMASWGVG